MPIQNHKDHGWCNKRVNLASRAGLSQNQCLEFQVEQSHKYSNTLSTGVKILVVVYIRNMSIQDTRPNDS